MVATFGGTITPSEMKKKLITNTKTNSKRKKGVLQYALEFVEQAGDNYGRENRLSYVDRKRNNLNGATDRKEYSWGGCAFIYNEDIAERLATPSELKKTNYGKRKPNRQEERLDTQARALYQADALILKQFRDN